MKITYKSVTGEVTAVEVPEEIGAVIIDSRRKEDNLDRKERYEYVCKRCLWRRSLRDKTMDG